MNNTRIIKNENSIIFTAINKEIGNLLPNTKVIHPLTLNVIKSGNNQECITKFDLQQKNPLIKPYKCQNKENNFNKYLYIPPVGFTSSDILAIYNIESIESLYSWIDENIESLYYLTINRVLNCWIKINFETLQNYNNFLEKIYNKLIIKLLDNKILKKLEDNLQKETKNFIDYWMKKMTLETINMKFDLLSDYIDYLNKKYK